MISSFKLFLAFTTFWEISSVVSSSGEGSSAPVEHRASERQTGVVSSSGEGSSAPVEHRASERQTGSTLQAEKKRVVGALEQVAMLKCIGVASPDDPDVKWFKNGIELSTEKGRSIDTLYQPPRADGSIPFQSLMIFTRVRKGHYGDYTVTAASWARRNEINKLESTTLSLIRPEEEFGKVSKSVLSRINPRQVLSCMANKKSKKPK